MLAHFLGHTRLPAHTPRDQDNAQGSETLPARVAWFAAFADTFDATCQRKTRDQLRLHGFQVQ
jgi:hypothetical protein